jgi:hypothetical protein
MPFLLNTESVIRKGAILSGAMEDARREFEGLKHFLFDHKIQRMADIGCGHAFIDLMFSRHFDCDVTLIDIEHTDSHQHDFNDTGSGYASLSQATAFLTSNGVPMKSIHTVNPQKTELPDGPFDLMISLLSAGFHYPIDEYAAYARSQLRPGGILVFDRRNNTGNDVYGFSKMDTVAAGSKYQRTALTL